MKKIISTLSFAALLLLAGLSASLCLAEEELVNVTQEQSVVDVNNPSRQELADYINNKIAGRLYSSYADKAAELERNYPMAAVFKTGVEWFFPADGRSCYETQSLWDQVDKFVDGIYGNDSIDDSARVEPATGQLFYTKTHYYASDESCNDFIGRWGLTLSEIEGNSEFPAGISKKVILLDNNQQEDRQEWATLLPGSRKPQYNGYRFTTTLRFGQLYPFIGEYKVTKIFVPYSSTATSAVESQNSAR